MCINICSYMLLKAGALKDTIANGLENTLADALEDTLAQYAVD